MTENILDKDKIIAIVARKNNHIRETKFLTGEKNSLQGGIIYRDEGDKIKAHVHNEVKREIKNTEEVLFVIYGEIQVDLFNFEKQKIKTLILYEGDIIIFVSGGHGITFNKESKLFEVKQGPYLGRDIDKTFL